MRSYSRRQFIKSSLVSAGALAAAPALMCGAEAPKTPGAFNGTDIVTLGKTGIKTTRLAHGTGFNGYNRSSELTRMGKEAFERVMHRSLDQGISFLDMADLYGSHPFVKDTVKGIKRDKLVLLSKIWPRKENWVTPSGGAKEELDRFRKELEVEMIDICLIHCMTEANWATTYARVCDELSELKQKGVIRAAGVSCHDFGALKSAASNPWVDVILARINYKGGKEYSMDGSAEEISEVLKLARKNGKAVIGMKIFGAGKLVKPEEKDASLKFVFTNDLVDAITIGFLQTEQVDDTLQRMSQVKKA